MDIEPLYYMLTHQYPLHRFFHTYVGASIVAVATVMLFAAARHVAKNTTSPGSGAVTLGAFAGAYSHILLDSVMHRDIRPFAPFSDSNPLLGVISLPALHWSCVIAGIAGLALLAVRSIRDRAP